MAIEGQHDTFKLRHGTSIREFKDVTVDRPQVRVWHDDPDIDGGTYYTKERAFPDEDRWELVGTELKVEVGPGGAPSIVEVPVRVGFFPDHIIE